MKGLCQKCKYFEKVHSDGLSRLGKKQLIINTGTMYSENGDVFFKGTVEYCNREDRVMAMSMDITGAVIKCGSYEEKKDDGKEI